MILADQVEVILVLRDDEAVFRQSVGKTAEDLLFRRGEMEWQVDENGRRTMVQVSDDTYFWAETSLGR